MKIGAWIAICLGLLVSLGLSVYAAFRTALEDPSEDEIFVDIRDRLDVIEERLAGLEESSPEAARAAVEDGFRPAERMPPEAVTRSELPATLPAVDEMPAWKEDPVVEARVRERLAELGGDPPPPPPPPGNRSGRRSPSSTETSPAVPADPPETSALPELAPVHGRLVEEASEPSVESVPVAPAAPVAPEPAAPPPAPLPGEVPAGPPPSGPEREVAEPDLSLPSLDEVGEVGEVGEVDELVPVVPPSE